MKHMFTKRNVHSSFIHTSSRMETFQMCINRKMDKQIVVYSGKEWTTDTFKQHWINLKNMLSKSSQTQEDIVCDSIYRNSGRGKTNLRWKNPKKTVTAVARGNGRGAEEGTGRHSLGRWKCWNHKRTVDFIRVPIYQIVQCSCHECIFCLKKTAQK